MASDYEYDIFLSYSRKKGVREWVQRHFEPMLRHRLAGEMPEDPRIFIDTSIDTGVAWPLELKKKLKQSKCLVAVWSPQYFRSAWCMAEWKSMLEREKVLGLKTSQQTRGLVYPVVFSDGQHFPKEANDTQLRKMHKWNYPYEVFKKSIEYLEFDKEIQDICKELSVWVNEAPEWKEDWPIVEPEIMKEIQTKAPRIE